MNSEVSMKGLVTKSDPDRWKKYALYYPVDINWHIVWTVFKMWVAKKPAKLTISWWQKGKVETTQVQLESGEFYQIKEAQK